MQHSLHIGNKKASVMLFFCRGRTGRRPLDDFPTRHAREQLMQVGSFFPVQAKSTLYAMGADDCSLFFDLQTLTEKQQLDHQAQHRPDLGAAGGADRAGQAERLGRHVRGVQGVALGWAAGTLSPSFSARRLSVDPARARHPRPVTGLLRLDRGQTASRGLDQPVHGQRHQFGPPQGSGGAGGQSQPEFEVSFRRPCARLRASLFRKRT